MGKREEILDKANTACYYFSDNLKQTVLNAMDIYAQHLLSEKEAEVKELKEKNEYINEVGAEYQSDANSLEKCVTEILGITEDKRIVELINDAVFHLCKNMK